MSTITFATEVCCKCGTTFQIDETLRQLRLNDGGDLYCPNGHGQHFIKSQKVRLEEAATELAEAKKELDDYKEECRRLKCLLMNKATQKKPTILEKMGLR